MPQCESRGCGNPGDIHIDFPDDDEADLCIDHAIKQVSIALTHKKADSVDLGDS